MNTARAARPTKTANQAYADSARSLDEKVAKLQAAIAKHRKQQASDGANWGYVGDLGFMHEQLDNILATFGA